LLLDLIVNFTSQDYDKKASANAIEDGDHVASWFRGFVKTHGIEKTKELLGASYLLVKKLVV